MTVPLPLVATALWLLAFVTSFTWLQPLETEFVIISLSSLIGAMALSDGAGISRREWPVPVSPVLLAGGLFWLVAAISVGMSDILYVSWVYFFIFSALPLGIAFFLAGHERERRIAFAWAGARLLLAGLAVYALVQYFFLPRMLFEGRVHEPLTDPNGLAAIFSLGIFVVAGRLLRTSGGMKPLDGILLFLMVLGFFTTGSRGAFLAAFIMAAAFIVAVGLRRISLRQWLAFGGVGVGALLLIGAFYTPTYFAGPIKLLYYSYHQVGLEKIFGERGLIWSAAMEMISRAPWFGTGPGTFPFYYPELRHPDDGTAGYMVHNDPLQFGVEMGVAGVVFFYAVFFLALLRTCKSLRALPSGDDRRLDILAPFCGLGAMVLHSHLTFNFHVLSCLFMAALVFSLWYQASALALGEKDHVIKAPPFMGSNSLEAVFMVIAFGVMTLVAAPLYSQVLTRGAEKALINGHLESFALQVNLSDTLSLGRNPQSYLLAAKIPLGILEQTQRPLNASERRNFEAQAQDIIGRGLRTNPRNTGLLVQQAQLMTLKRDNGAAEAILNQALRIDPLDLGARMELGLLLDREGRLDEAVAVMNAGIDRRYGPARASQYMEYFIQAMALQEKQAEQGRSAPKP